MKTPTLLAAALAVGAMRLCAGEAPASPAERPRSAAPHATIDDAVFNRLKALGIEPAVPCTDEVFLRRVYLDIIGTVPTREEAKSFLLDVSPGKRTALIDRLLQRPEFADYWAMKWSDLLRVKAEFPINLWPNAANAYFTWIRTSLKENLPYDRFARELLTASGSNFRVPQVNFYRALQSKDPEALARTVALTLMGERAEKWPKERLAGMAAFFACVGYKSTREWKEEIVFFDVAKAASPEAPKTATFPDGTSVPLSPDRDPRELFADWLITPKNPWFTRNIANRAWYWLVGRGIIHEPDDIRPDNPPSNPELLALLEDELRAANYDLKHLFRLILNSKAYQLSAVPRSTHPEAEANFASYAIRRLDAEVLIDALNQITGTTEEYSSAIPEPFTWIPENRRSIALPDGSITSAFLEMFGRPPRDTGLEAERSNKFTPAQRLHMLNSSHVRRKITEGGPLQPLLSGAKSQQAAATELYLTILSRFPTPRELEIVRAYSETEEGKGTAALVDLAWALFNSTEFLYRH
ncbi:MAG TPA: DUF1553 domain-containing protein [Planctomycetota bacterium]|nr:DUF1553 domain-containing protein [Planctomycetota bacterium]HRR78689.1 DUF1553 domain-containing protein [Planctomycetota bacterium]HRT93357.1 DUF1553 domain-containing protein [Planctomycetota bacterium]